MDVEILATLPMWFVAFLLSLTCHEASHALAAKIGGDLTAFHGGQVTLDPIPHIKREPFGTVVVPILTFLLNGGGWMIGWASAPYDPLWADRHPRRAALMAAAGPAANFVLVLLVALIIHGGIAAGVFDRPPVASFERVVAQAGGGTSAVTMFLSILFSLNLLLGTFNLLPVPPLDGNGVVGLFMGEDTARRWAEMSRRGGFGIFGLLLAWVVYGRIYGYIFTFALNLLYPGSAYG